MGGNLFRHFLGTASVLSFVIALLGSGCSHAMDKPQLLEQAEKLYQTGQYEAAEIQYLNVLRLDQTNQTAIQHLGLIAFANGQVGRAFAILTHAKKTNPKNFDVRLALAQCQLAGGAPAPARDEALLLLKEQPTNEMALRLLVKSSISSNQLQQAGQLVDHLESSGHAAAGFTLARGMIQARNGNFPEAEKSLQKSIALNPLSSAAYVALGNLYVAKNDRQQAEAAYKNAEALAPPRSPDHLPYVDFELATGNVAEGKRVLEKLIKETRDYLPAQTRLAQIALNERDFTKCESLVKGVIGRDATNLEAMLLLARLRTAQGEPAKAVAELQHIVKEYPRVPAIHYQLALAQLANNDSLGDAANSLNQALNLQPDFPEAVMLLAELNLRRNEARLAIDSLAKLVSQHPKLPGAQLLLAAAYQAANEDDAALKVYQRLAQLYPANPQIPLRTGALLRHMNRNSQARDSYESALKIDPNYLPALEELVNLDLADKQFAVARERVQSQIAKRPETAALYLLLGRVCFADRDFTGAERALLKSLELGPDSSAANVLLSRVYLNSNRQPEALKNLQAAVTKNTNDVASWLQIAQLQSATSNHTAAQKAYETILTINPQSIAALNNLAWLNLENFGNAPAAYQLASKARRLQPDDPFIADTLGWVLYRTGDYPRALGLIRQSAERLPDEPQVFFHLGMTYYSLGQEGLAKSTLEKALGKATDEPWIDEAKLRLRILSINPSGPSPQMAAELKDLLNRAPNDLVLLTRVASLSAREAKWQQAATNYENALSINSNLVPVLVDLAQLYTTHLKNPERALALARQARQTAPNDPGVAHLLGKLAFDSAKSEADYRWAFSLLQESARKLPNDPEVQFDYAWALFSVGQLSEATAVMQKAFEAQPPSSRHEQAGKFLQMSSTWNHPDEVEKKAVQIQEILQAEPNYAPALLALASLQERRGEVKAACTTYEQSLTRFPLLSPATKWLARLYFDSVKDTTKAYAYAKQAREAFPQDPQVARILGSLEYERGNMQRAAQLLADSAKTFPTDPELHYRLGFALAKLKQSSAGQQALTTALALAPTSPLAAEAKRLLADLK